MEELKLGEKVIKLMITISVQEEALKRSPCQLRGVIVKVLEPVLSHTFHGDVSELETHVRKGN